MRKHKKKIKLTLSVILSLILLLSVQLIENFDNYTLEQVVFFSRHALRAPLASPTSIIGKVIPNQ